MTEPRTARISARKSPRQARSNALVEAILGAAVQVLTSEGAQRFTCARVAERAGVSVGSLYQYFPNKAAILFRLQCDEWAETAGVIAAILDDRALPPLARMRKLVHAFVLSECEEAAVRNALDDAAPLYRHAAEARAVRHDSEASVIRFLREALPQADDAARARAADLIGTTLSAVGKHISEGLHPPDEIHARADALADMLCAYLAP
jgi:AcrR family transcriptional regulator